MLCDHTTYGFNFLSIATANLLAVCFARRDKESAERVLSESFVVAAVLGAMTAACYFAFGPALLGLVTGSSSSDLIAPGTTYLRWRAPGIVAALMTSIMQVRGQPPLRVGL